MTPARADLLAEWRRTVNVPAPAIWDWLATAESGSVGTPSPVPGRSVGQLAGEQNASMLDSDPDDWTEVDWQHARRTLGFVRRHRAQWPNGDVTHRRWRHSLRNWGHDPLWEGRLVTPSATPGRHPVVVDDAVIGEVRVEDSAMGPFPALILLEDEWRGRGIARALLHGSGVVDLDLAGLGPLDAFVEDGTAWIGDRAGQFHDGEPG